MSATRIYVVRYNENEKAYLIRATSASQAIRHVTRKFYDAVIPTQDDLVSLISAGIKVEDAVKEE